MGIALCSQLLRNKHDIELGFRPTCFGGVLRDEDHKSACGYPEVDRRRTAIIGWRLVALEMVISLLIGDDHRTVIIVIRSLCSREPELDCGSRYERAALR